MSVRRSTLVDELPISVPTRFRLGERAIVEPAARQLDMIRTVDHALVHTDSVEDDIWSEWLLQHRFGEDKEYAEGARAVIAGYADRVLDFAELKEGQSLLDIGSGEGLVPFRAIDRIGSSLKVTITDVSVPMLRYAEALARRKGVVEQCQFVECPGDRLIGIPDSSLDVVTSRAALAYVADKLTAFAEIYRVLKPGGRMSIAEPVFADDSLSTQQLRRLVDLTGETPENRLLRLVHRCRAAQFPDTPEAQAQHPLVNYTERDVLVMAQNAGFKEMHVELHMDVTRSTVKSWDVLLAGSPHPWSRTLGAILEQDFTQEDRDFFEAEMRPIVKAGADYVIERTVYVSANKPL